MRPCRKQKQLIKKASAQYARGIIVNRDIPLPQGVHMRLLYWVCAIACTFSIAHAQLPREEIRREETKPPTGRQIVPPQIQKPQSARTPGTQLTTPSVLDPHTFHGRVYHGRLTWEQGQWHHVTRNGRLGWWWDVGGAWYFYPEAIEGPPDYVSDVETNDTEAPTPPTPTSSIEPRRIFYYKPGDLKGTLYESLEECLAIVEQAATGICVIK